jgi:hypothetical protein
VEISAADLVQGDGPDRYTPTDRDVALQCGLMIGGPCDQGQLVREATDHRPA